MRKVLQRDRCIVLAALAAVVALSWVYLAYIVVAQPAMDMDAISMAAMPPPVWDVRYFAATLVMWMVMMIGMMLPSAAPTLLLFDALEMQRGAPSHHSTALFGAGYMLAWGAFSVLAATTQWALSAAKLLSATMIAKPVFGGVLLALAGAYQFTPWKTACLRQCRSPAEFLSRHYRPGPLRPLSMGLRHGVYCIGCCWALMVLLFAFGVMNLLWVAVLAVFVLAEKVAPAGALIGRIGAVAMISGGAMLMALG
jgi:predicted metal-binding membrane protein